MASPIMTSLDLVEDCRSPVPIHPLAVVQGRGVDLELPYLYRAALMQMSAGDIITTLKTVRINSKKKIAILS